MSDSGSKGFMSFKILTYNAPLNCDGDVEEKKKIMQLAAFLKKRDLDVVIVLGLMGIQHQLGVYELFKKQAGFEIGSLFPYNQEQKSMLVLSKEPYDIVDHEEMLHFHNCFKQLYFPQLDLAVFPTHMTPHNIDHRNVEIDFVEEIVASTEANRVIVAGTFNGLPPEFCLEVDPTFFKNDKEIYKYTTGDKAICYHTVNRMNAQWVDAHHAQMNKPEQCFTVPTSANKNPTFFYPMRLDYVFTSKSLEPFVESCRTIYDATTDELTDRYPVEVVFSRI